MRWDIEWIDADGTPLDQQGPHRETAEYESQRWP